MKNHQLKIITALETNKDLWNGYLDNKSIPPLARFEWKYVLETVYKAETIFLMVLNKKEDVVGTLPLYFIKDYSDKSMAFTLKYGFIVENETIGECLLEYLDNILIEKDAVYTSLSTGIIKYNFKYKEDVSYTVTLKLMSDKDSMWSFLSAKVRNMVRKAERDGIIVQNGKDKIKQFYNVYSQRMINKNARIHSIYYFIKIIKFFPDNVELFIATKEDKTIGGMLLFYNKENGMYMYGGSKIIKNQTSPNQLLLWKMVEFSIDKDLKYLDLGESVPGTGVHNFKLWFGGKTKKTYAYSSREFNFDKLSLSNNKLLFIKRQFFRAVSYILIRYSPKYIKKKIAIWKRAKGALQ
tara:strand:+ start:243 stop:1298 length:1056 start_codon:yes stop_codon:yes gene_type:complete